MHACTRRYRAAFQMGGVLCMVQEYAAGGTLSAAIETRGREYGGFGTRTVARLLHELALGLRHMHECGVLHRDLSTKNVLLSGSGTVKIGDFGLSREMSASGNGSFSGRGSLPLDVTSFCGTPLYAASRCSLPHACMPMYLFVISHMQTHAALVIPHTCTPTPH